MTTLPYNPFNNLINKDNLDKLLKNFGVEDEFIDINIYRKAFVHKSYCTRKNENFIDGNVNCPKDCLPLQEESNERLEYLGDSILNMIVADYLFERYPDENEGFLTRMRTKIVNGKMLANLSFKIGLNNYVLISKQIEDNEGRKNLNILEDCFEAFIAAIYLDFGETGFKNAKLWIVGVMEENLDFPTLIKEHNNYKDLLLKYFQQNFGYTPKFYEMNIETNPSNNSKIYTICIKDDKGTVISIAKSGNKKDGENEAAKLALNQYTKEYDF